MTHPTDFRALLGKYMLAAEEYESGAGDAPALLSDDVSDDDMAELNGIMYQPPPRPISRERERDAT